MGAQGGAGCQPKSKTVFSYKSGLDRNDSPKSPTTGSSGKDEGSYGTFKYTSKQIPLIDPK